MRRWLDTGRKRVVALALVCWLGVLGVMEAVEVPYVRMAPGPVFNVLGDVDGSQVIEVDGARQYPVDGRLDMTTVSERGGPFGDLTLFEAFTGWLDPAVSVVPTAVLYPVDTSDEQVERAGVEQFNDSQEKARIAALRELGEPVQTRPWVVQVRPDSAAEGVLEHGDVVLRIDGKTVDGPKQMARIVRRAGAGATIGMDLRRDGRDESVEVTTAANPDDPSAGYLGVTLGVLADSPITVDFNLDDIGGPSAGLVFSLGIVDKLTPEDLLDGTQVAGTGTMDYDGRVGPIGGVAQKMAAARNAGATLFLAPEANCGQIDGAVPAGLTVAAVSTLRQARDVLQGRLDPPQCPA